MAAVLENSDQSESRITGLSRIPHQHQHQIKAGNYAREPEVIPKGIPVLTKQSDPCLTAFKLDVDDDLLVRPYACGCD